MAYSSQKYKLADGVFYRLYGKNTILYNTEKSDYFVFNDTAKIVFDEFNKNEYTEVDVAIQDILNNYVFKSNDSDPRAWIISFINELVDNSILIKKNVLTDNRNSIESQAQKSIIPKNQLVSVQFEISYRCQERCRYCYCVTDTPERKELSTKEIKSLIDDLVKMNVMEIVFTGGDPFVRNDIFELLKYSYDSGLMVGIFTNGFSLSDNDIFFLKSIAIKEIDFSIYSHIPEKHDYFTQLEGSFNKTIDAIKKCVLIGIPVRIKTPAMNYNKNDIEHVIELAEELGVSIQVGLSITPRNNRDKDPMKYRLESLKDYVDIMKVLNEHFVPCCSENVFDVRDRDPDIICRSGTTSISINPYGDVFPCNTLLIKCGNVRENHIQEIWSDSKELKKIRTFRFTDVKGCQKCTMQRWCTFCPGVALTETGDPLSRYDEACILTEADTIMGKGEAPFANALDEVSCLEDYPIS